MSVSSHIKQNFYIAKNKARILHYTEWQVLEADMTWKVLAQLQDVWKLFIGEIKVWG